MTTKDLKKLRKNLPNKWRNTLSERTGYSVSMIQQVLKGEKVNDDIIKEAVKLAKETKEKKSELMAEIASL